MNRGILFTALLTIAVFFGTMANLSAQEIFHDDHPQSRRIYTGLDSFQARVYSETVRPALVSAGLIPDLVSEAPILDYVLPEKMYFCVFDFFGIYKGVYMSNYFDPPSLMLVFKENPSFAWWKPKRLFPNFDFMYTEKGKYRLRKVSVGELEVGKTYTLQTNRKKPFKVLIEGRRRVHTDKVRSRIFVYGTILAFKIPILIKIGSRGHEEEEGELQDCYLAEAVDPKIEAALLARIQRKKAEAESLRAKADRLEAEANEELKR